MRRSGSAGPVTDKLDPEPIAQRLLESGLVSGITGRDLTVLSTKGVSHDHWRIGDSGLVLRIPRMNQWDLSPEAALAYQAATFERAAASGRTPSFEAALAPGPDLPRGALVVTEIVGRPPAIPDDLAAIADTLARIHGLPLPAKPQMLPLQVHRHPVSSTLQIIEEQIGFIADAKLDPESEAGIQEDLAWAREFAGRGEPDFALSLVCTDAHPGNFLIDADGIAWFVDLEKALYGAVPIDLAHVTLATSTGWDPDCTGDATRDDVQNFYQHYLDLVGRDRAAELGPWLLPLRRLTWLRTMTWFVRWRAEWSRSDHAALRDARMTAHVMAHLDRCFAPENVAAARGDWLAPQALTI